MSGKPKPLGSNVRAQLKSRTHVFADLGREYVLTYMLMPENDCPARDRLFNDLDLRRVARRWGLSRPSIAVLAGVRMVDEMRAKNQNERDELVRGYRFDIPKTKGDV